MIVSIHQPHYLPWLRYFDKIARSDVFIALDDVEFTRNGWQNRNRVKTAAGPLTLTVPVRHRRAQRIVDVALDTEVPWARKHLATLRQAYARAPHRDALLPSLEELCSRPWERLVDLNLALLSWHLRALGLETPVVRSSSLGVGGRASERLVALVQAVGGHTYLSGRHALGVYLDPRPFQEAGLDLRVHDWKCPEYEQVHAGVGFVPDLATLDLLLVRGERSREVLAAGGRIDELEAG